MEGVNLDIKPDQMEGMNEKNSPSRKFFFSEMTPTKTFEIGNQPSAPLSTPELGEQQAVQIWPSLPMKQPK